LCCQIDSADEIRDTGPRGMHPFLASAGYRNV
jgi:hypothetical protein